MAIKWIRTGHEYFDRHMSVDHGFTIERFNSGLIKFWGDPSISVIDFIAFKSVCAAKWHANQLILDEVLT